jgi:hypothetical protein
MTALIASTVMALGDVSSTPITESSGPTSIRISRPAGSVRALRLPAGLGK